MKWNGTQWQLSATEVAVREEKTKDYLFVHLAGDSVTRNMFARLCRLIANTKHKKRVHEKKYGYCCRDRVCLTFRSTWFPLKEFFPEWFKLEHPTRKSFCGQDAQCLKLVPQEMFHWASSDIEVENRISVLHLSFYGSHTPLLGPSEKTCAQLRLALSATSTAQNFSEKTLIFGTPAIRSEWIPDKYAEQSRYRTNARIAALNEALLDCIGEASWVNMFHMSFARNKDDFTDAIHMKNNASEEIAEAIVSALYSGLEVAHQ